MGNCILNNGIKQKVFDKIGTNIIYQNISTSGSYKVTDKFGVCAKVSGYAWGDRYANFYIDGTLFFDGMDKSAGSEDSFIWYPIGFNHTLSWSANPSNAYVYIYPLIYK